MEDTNKLIAEFMGAEEVRKDNFKFPNRGLPLQIDAINYHSHWNWLMPVVEKIERDSLDLLGEYEDIIINGCGCFIHTTKHDGISKTETTKINAVYNAVVEYIKWHNQQGTTLTKITKDKFVWKLVTQEQAEVIFTAELFDLYELRDDDSESLIETFDHIKIIFENGLKIGIEVGQLKQIS